MISVSVGEILQGWDEDPFDTRIYLIRDDKFVFFVGVLEGAILDHVLRHCGLVYNGPPADRVGRLILDNAPSSNGWVVDLLSLENCAPIIRLAMLNLNSSNDYLNRGIYEQKSPQSCPQSIHFYFFPVCIHNNHVS
jgi:hypothetical protein